jgi:hypothetical protein
MAQGGATGRSYNERLVRADASPILSKNGGSARQRAVASCLYSQLHGQNAGQGFGGYRSPNVAKCAQAVMLSK